MSNKSMFYQPGETSLYSTIMNPQMDAKKNLLKGLDDHLLFRVMCETIGFENLAIIEWFQVQNVDLTSL